MNITRTELTRRRFLGGCLGAAAGYTGAGSALGLLQAFTAGAAQAQADDYKALVCVYLYGGNDGFGFLIPSDTASYDLYASPRKSLSVPLNQLLPLSPAGGEKVGLHPRAAGLQNLFRDGRLAFSANTGVLLAPTTRADYLADRNLPPALFSHNDQQDHWMSGAADRIRLSGWGGRIAELLASRNGSSPLPMNISVHESNLLQVGSEQVPFIVNPEGVETLRGLRRNAYARSSAYYATLGSAQGSINALEQAVAGVNRRTIDLGEMLGAALDDTTSPETQFPVSKVADQLRMVSHLIAARSRLGVQRQVFFVGVTGFDTHNDQVADYPIKIGELSEAVSAFQTEITRIGVAANTTLFSMSDFGRSLTSNGDGTDHGWGSHHFVVGDAVQGGRLYGRLPNLTLEGPDDSGRGRIIPSTATEQYLAPLARWFGVGNAEITTVFPNLDRFPAGELRYLG